MSLADWRSSAWSAYCVFHQSRASFETVALLMAAWLMPSVFGESSFPSDISALLVDPGTVSAPHAHHDCVVVRPEIVGQPALVNESKCPVETDGLDVVSSNQCRHAALGELNERIGKNRTKHGPAQPMRTVVRCHCHLDVVIAVPEQHHAFDATVHILSGDTSNGCRVVLAVQRLVHEIKVLRLQIHDQGTVGWDNWNRHRVCDRNGLDVRANLCGQPLIKVLRKCEAKAGFGQFHGAAAVPMKP